MPEGPSIVILKEAVAPFTEQTVITAGGNASKVPVEELEGKKVRSFKSWGKHLLICFDDFYIRIHLLMFGSYRINDNKATTPRLSLQFAEGELNFYTCSVQLIRQSPDEVYDWTGDVMNPAWDHKKAREKLEAKSGKLVCDLLLDQDIFAGVGNIIKNEVLYRTRVHPKNRFGDLPEIKKEELITEAVNYAFDFLEWKKAFTLKNHWLAHTKTTCLRCHLPLHKEYLGTTKRRTFFCTGCQILYASANPVVPGKK